MPQNNVFDVQDQTSMSSESSNFQETKVMHKSGKDTMVMFVSRIGTTMMRESPIE